MLRVSDSGNRNPAQSEHLTRPKAGMLIDHGQGGRGQPAKGTAFPRVSGLGWKGGAQMVVDGGQNTHVSMCIPVQVSFQVGVG